MANGGTPAAETVNLDEAPVASTCTLLSSIERVFVSLDFAACPYGMMPYAPGGEIDEPIRIFVDNAGPNI